MLSIIFVIFALTVLLAFLEEYLGKPKKYMYWTICFALVLYAAFRPIGFDRDASTYEFYFLYSDNPIVAILVEPSYSISSKLLMELVRDVHVIFLMYAMISIPLKFNIFKKYVPEYWFLPIIIYLGNYFVLHDLTQIRASVAATMFLYAVYMQSEGKRWKAFGFILLGFLFHYSSLILLPILFINNASLTKRWKIILAAVVPVSFLIGMLNVEIVAQIPIPGIQEKLDSYQNLKSGGKYYDKSALLTPFTYIRFFIFYYCLYFSEIIEKHVKSINILLKIMAASIFLYYFFATITIFSQRFSELYGIIEIILYSTIVFTSKPKWMGKVVVLLIALYQVYYSYYSWTMLDFRAFGRF